MPEPDPNGTPEHITIPDDAGVHAESLRTILQRIPREWGRYISCGKGWYPLVIKLDRELANVAPNYQIQQVKEKYGSLRYYTTLPQLVPQCCQNFERNDPAPAPRDFLNQKHPSEQQQQFEYDAWQERHEEHVQSTQCKAAWRELEDHIEQNRRTQHAMNGIIQRYEALSACTCEQCGTTIGARLRIRAHWFKTLCPSCGLNLGYMHIA